MNAILPALNPIFERCELKANSSTIQLKSNISSSSDSTLGLGCFVLS